MAVFMLTGRIASLMAVFMLTGRIAQSNGSLHVNRKDRVV